MKIIKKILLVTMASLMIFQLVACSNNSSGEEYEITMEEYNTVLEQYKAMYKAQAGEENWDSILKNDKEFMDSLEELVLEQVLLEKVIMNEATLTNVEVTDEEVNTELDTIKGSYTNTEDYEAFLKSNNYTEESFTAEIKRQLIMTKYLKSKAEEIMAIEPSEDELKELYEQHATDFKQVQASHILVDSEAKAFEIKAKIDAGEDFATLAKEFSSCSSAADGGDLGYFTAGQMVEEFSNAAFSMAVGEISNPVKSDFGYHIIKVTDIKDSFDDVDKEEVKYQYRALQYNEMINNFTSKANVKLPKELQEIRERSKKNM